MSGFNFLRESELHIHYGSSRYNVKITPNLSFNQTFAEDAYSVKTLHDQTKMFQGTSVTKANPADFSFEVHLTKEKDEQIVLDLLTDYDTTSGEQLLKSFDMYVVSSESTFKLEGCVITTGDFNFAKDSPLILSVSGQAKKLSRVGNESYSLPGTLQPASATRTPTKPLLDVEIDGSDVTNLATTVLSIANNINWTPYETLQDSLAVTSASNAIYPSNYSLDDRTLSGNITQFNTNANASEFQTFDTSTNIDIKTIVDGVEFFHADLNGCMFTKRSNPGEVFTQTYDYRLVESPTDLGRHQPENGLTLSETMGTGGAAVNIDSHGGTEPLYSATETGQPTVFSGEVNLPSSFSADACLWEHGGTGVGSWLGVRQISGVYNFVLRSGEGTASVTATSNDGIISEKPISEIPEFDGQVHTVCWELHPTNGTHKLWIDGKEIFNDTTTGGGAFDANKWSGGNPGGWLKGQSTASGNYVITAWPVTTGSSGLRHYFNQVATDNTTLITY